MPRKRAVLIALKGGDVKTADVLKFVLGMFAVLLFFGMPVFADSAFLTEGIQQYQEENFEEAIGILIKAREEEPDSTTAAFFLGMAYKQTLDYANAAIHLRDAVQMEPRIREALVELIEVLVRINTPESVAEAKSWIAIAKDQNIEPAKVAFLEGLALQ